MWFWAFWLFFLLTAVLGSTSQIAFWIQFYNMSHLVFLVLKEEMLASSSAAHSCCSFVQPLHAAASEWAVWTCDLPRLMQGHRGKWDSFLMGSCCQIRLKEFHNCNPSINFAAQPRKGLVLFHSLEVSCFSVAVFILVLFSVLTQLKFIHPELGEQSCLQYSRVFILTQPFFFWKYFRFTLWSHLPLSQKVSFHFGQHWCMSNDLYFPLLLRGTYDLGLLVAFTVLSEPAWLLLRGFAKLLLLPKELE